MNVSEAIRAAALRLAATSDTARLDAELLMAHALGVTRSDLLLRHTGDTAPDSFAALIDRRASHEPVAYIIGNASFYGREFAVGPGVLIPRSDSESVAAVALEGMSDAPRVLDMGTGSGALLLTLLAECEGAQGVGIDRSGTALDYARRNADALRLEDRVEWMARDWTQAGWHADLGQFDTIICNPPYVESEAVLEPDVRAFEPAGALFAGADVQRSCGCNGCCDGVLVAHVSPP